MNINTYKCLDILHVCAHICIHTELYTLYSVLKRLVSLSCCTSLLLVETDLDK